MIKILPKKLIAIYIMAAGYSRIILSKYKTVLILSLLCLFFMGLSSVLLYQKYANRPPEAVQEDEWVIEYEPPKEKIVQPDNTRKNIDVAIPEEHLKRSESYYVPYSAPERKYIYQEAPAQKTSSLDQEIQDRRIMELETKVNNYEIERDMRLLH